VIPILGTIAIVAVVVVAGYFADRRFGILPRGERLRDDGEAKRVAPGTAFAAGEAPATALAPNPAALARLRATPPRCTGDAVAMVADPDDLVKFAGKDMLVLRFRCPTCSAARSIYCQTDRLQPA
jgi:hypothetical protein